MITHRHNPGCWVRYDPCGEHHAHNFNCGGGQLSTGCPEYENDRKYQIAILSKRIQEVVRWQDQSLAVAALEHALAEVSGMSELKRILEAKKKTPRLIVIGM
jgi:hypothetical protein